MKYNEDGKGKQKREEAGIKKSRMSEFCILMSLGYIPHIKVMHFTMQVNILEYRRVELESIALCLPRGSCLSNCLAVEFMLLHRPPLFTNLFLSLS